MKTFINALTFAVIILLVGFAITTTSCSKDDDNDPNDSTNTGDNNGNVTLMKKYGIEKGIFIIKSYSTLLPNDYDYDTIYFKEYGAYEVNYSTNGEDNELDLVNGDGYQYSINLTDKTGTKIASKYANGTEASIEYEDLTSQGDKLIKLADTTICGKTCTYYKYNVSETLYSKTATYKGIQLYYVATTSNTMGFAFSAISECISIQENVDVPASKFVVPTGITYYTYK